MNPQAIAAITQAAIPFLTSPRPPTQDQVNAAFAQTQAATRKNLVIAGALVGGAALLYLLASRD